MKVNQNKIIGINMAKQGYSIKQITEALGCNRTTVYRWLKEEGYRRVWTKATPYELYIGNSGDDYWQYSDPKISKNDKVYKLRRWQWQGEGKPWLDIEQDYVLGKGVVAQRVLGDANRHGQKE